MKRMFSTIRETVFGTSVLLGLPLLAVAQGPPAAALAPDTFITLLETVVNWFFAVILVLSVLILLYGSFLFLTAAGSDEKVGQAKTLMIWAVVGFSVALLSRGILLMVCGIWFPTGCPVTL